MKALGADSRRVCAAEERFQVAGEVLASWLDQFKVTPVAIMAAAKEDAATSLIDGSGEKREENRSHAIFQNGL